jgi:hypothetical protein
MKKNNTEVMEVEAEEMLPEMELEKTINTELTKANVTDQVIAALKDKYGSMVLKSVDDKESYLELKASKREVAKVRIIAEKITKRGRESAIKIQRLWLAKEKEVVGKIDEVESHLANEIKKFDDEVERKENEEKQRREEAFMARQASLFKYGAEYRNGNYELSELSYESELIKNADDEMWEGIILPKYKRVYEQKEAARVAEETRRREEMERQEKERIELEEKQAAFRKEQEEFERQKRELQEQKDKQDREIREAEQKKQHEEFQKRISIRNSRVSELKNLGCRYDEQDGLYLYGSFAVVSVEELEALSEQDWVALLLEIKPKIEKIKADEEEIRNAKIEKEKQEAAELATKKERERIAEEERLAAIKKAEEMEQASDKTKYEDVVKYLSDYPAYEMRSGVYKKRMNVIKDFIADLKEN